MSDSIYLPLSTLKREIRLVKIYPDSGRTEIKCELSIVDLDGKPAYKVHSPGSRRIPS